VTAVVVDVVAADNNLPGACICEDAIAAAISNLIALDVRCLSINEYPCYACPNYCIVADVSSIEGRGRDAIAPAGDYVVANSNYLAVRYDRNAVGKDFDAICCDDVLRDYPGTLEQ